MATQFNHRFGFGAGRTKSHEITTARIDSLTQGDTKFVRLSHIVLIGLFALASWAPVIVAQDLIN